MNRKKSENSLSDVSNTDRSQKIAIVGSEGTLGQIASNGLEQNGYDITRIDVTPSINQEESHLLDLSKTYEDPKIEETAKLLLEDCDAVINYGWNASKEDFTSRDFSPENKQLAENIYKLSHDLEIPMVIQASSIHAGSLPAYSSVKNKDSVNKMIEETEEPYQTIISERIPDPEQVVPTDRISPDSPYGSTKVDIESLGKYHTNSSIHNSETTHYDSPLNSVVAIRYGGVNIDNEVSSFLEEEPLYDTIWMSKEDVVRQVNSILESDNNGFHRVYGISDNDGNPYSLDNEFGFNPEDNAADMI